LWTLSWEIGCYLIIGVVLGILRPQLARIALLVPFLVGSAIVFALDAGWGPVPTPPDWPLVPVLTFLAGSLVYLFPDLIPASPAVAAVCAALVAAISELGFAPSLVHLPMCIFLMAGSLHLPPAGVGSRYDDAPMACISTTDTPRKLPELA
jgi:peptidoglycan/LPS O-acetylase OafA/YrhL